jgi:hypothetical protein
MSQGFADAAADATNDECFMFCVGHNNIIAKSAGTLLLKVRAGFFTAHPR